MRGTGKGQRPGLGTGAGCVSLPHWEKQLSGESPCHGHYLETGTYELPHSTLDVNPKGQVLGQ